LIDAQASSCVPLRPLDRRHAPLAAAIQYATKNDIPSMRAAPPCRARASAIHSGERPRYVILDKAMLLVEDSALDVELVLHAAERCGIAGRIVVRRDGQEALDYLAAPGRALPALVLLDLHMPGRDGFDVLKTLRATPALSDMAVVIMSTSNLDADLRRAALLGVRDYIVKTADMGALVGHLQRLSDEYLT
jgi:CheY-like chemotaxis protein